MIRPRRITLLIVLIALLASASSSNGSGADERLSFAALVDVAPLNDDASRAVAAHVITRLRGDTPLELPAAVRDDALPRGVMVSISNGTDPARVVTAIERGAARAADAAVTGAEAAVPDADERQWIKVDIIRHAQPLSPAEPMLVFDTSLQGIVLNTGGGGLALLPEEVTNRGLIATNGRLQAEVVREYLERDPRVGGEAAGPRDEPRATHRFTTSAFFADGSGDDALVPLFRGHRPFPHDALDADEPLLAANAAAAYLVGATGHDGQFAYLYHADRDEPDLEDYNIVRHCGTTWAMLDLYGTSRDPELLAAAERAIGFLLEQVRPVRILDRDVSSVAWSDEVTLGGNALAALALAEHVRVSGDTRHLKSAMAIGQALRAAQQQSGRFLVQRQRLSSGRVFASDSPYFPGEATLAFVRLAAVDRNGAAEWLDAAERAAQYLITVRDAGVADADLPSDHWLLYALDGLHRARPREMYVDHAMRIASAIVANQAADRGGDAADTAGSWGGGRSNPTGTRVEGLMAAARLARSAGRPDDATRFLDAARRGTAFQLRTQVRPELAMYFPHPTRVIGAIREDLRRTDIRIDTVQHTVSAFLAVHRMLATP